MRKISFTISSIDGLGQGVSKDSDKITFIPKTAVGDTGEAVVASEKKGVAFARVQTFKNLSKDRIKPACPHFEQCPSCQLQHINYDEELRVKKEAFERLFRKLTMPATEVVSAPRRVEYRNRVQLHYDLRVRRIGMLDASQNSIVSIPNCLISLPEISDEIRRLYAQDRWMQEAPKSQDRGHVELYLREGKVHTSWNRPYAAGGFSQVFEEMNQKLKEILRTEWVKPTHLLDLFAGNGNLSNNLEFSSRHGFDVYHKPPGPDFTSLDLYSKDALRIIAKKFPAPDAVLLDPPRSGFKELALLLAELKPKHVAYVACDPHTLARDVSSLNDYSVTRAFVMDFFPSTFHFESLLFLQRNC